MPLQKRNSISDTLAHLDWLTVGIYALMIIYGIISIYAASYDFDEASMFSFNEFSGKQMVWVIPVVAIAFIILLIEPRMFETYAVPIYALMMLVLFITPFVAHSIHGSRSWISFGSMSVQPAEFAKFATALMLAKLFSTYNFTLAGNLGNYAKAVGIIMLPVVLILLQNETGSALTFMALFLVLYREGMPGLILFAAFLAVVVFVVGIKYSQTIVMGMPTGQFAVMLIVLCVVVGMSIVYGRRLAVARNLVLGYLAAALVLWIVSLCGVQIHIKWIMIAIVGISVVYVSFEALRDRMPRLFIPAITAILAIGFLYSADMAFNKLQTHQRKRIEVVLGLDEDIKDAGYNVNQSKIAIGSGGFSGKGFLNGTQTKLKFVPEQHTDFIFCTIGEEQGFVGSVAVIALFVALILRMIALAERQPKTFGRVYGYCVASYFTFHFFINIGMVIGLCPVIGIPLPFFSYGGSSLLAFTILIFIMLRIDAGRRNVLSS